MNAANTRCNWDEKRTQYAKSHDIVSFSIMQIRTIFN